MLISRSSIALGLISCLCMISPLSRATVVQFQTVMGEFEVNLYDESTPATVANFLSYVDTQAYNDSLFHRSVNGFVIQGGGFSAANGFPGSAIASNAAVVNEPEFSNVRGSIAMAKLGGDPNSATNQWFINLGDNSQNLDGQNGGFTVFGQVMGEGMAVVDAIADLQRFNFSSVVSAYTNLPLRDYTGQNAADGVIPTEENLVTVSAIVVVDAAADTAKDLQPAINEIIRATPVPSSGGGSGGGSSGLLFLLLAAAAFARGRLRVIS